MSIDLSKVVGWDTDRGALVQVTDASGRVLWAVSGGKVILEVEKITSNTYAGETTYTGEQFILLDIYPESNGTVKVTYGGLTKTITDTSGAEFPNAQQVFFGTFNGVSDSVTTPASGELTIEGDCVAFAISTFASSSKLNAAYTGITAIKDFGKVKIIPPDAFHYSLTGCDKITDVNIPGNVLEIGDNAFVLCTSLESVVIANGLKKIGAQAFGSCSKLTSVIIPASVESIGVNPWYAPSADCFITVDSGNDTYKIDGNCLIEITTNKIITGFVNSVIPNYVESIGANAFSGQGDIINITIPASVKIVEANAFSGSNIKCTFTMLSDVPPTLGNEAAMGIVGNTHFIVNRGRGEAYKTAQYWSNYADYITEAS